VGSQYSIRELRQRKALPVEFRPERGKGPGPKLVVFGGGHVEGVKRNALSLNSEILRKLSFSKSGDPLRERTSVRGETSQ